MTCKCELRTSSFSQRPRKRAKTPAEIAQRQKDLAAKKMEIAKSTPLGQPLPYVDSKAGIYKIKVPVAPMSAILAPPLPDIIKIYPDKEVHVPRYWKYVKKDDPQVANVILVKKIESGLYSVAGLLARLHGIRLCDLQWAMSKTQEGHCLAFSCAMQIHCYLFLTDGFRNAFPEHTDVLMKSQKLKASIKNGLTVQLGNSPEKPVHPRLTLEATAFNLEVVLERLTQLQRV